MDLPRRTLIRAPVAGAGYLAEHGRCRWRRYAELLGKAAARMAALGEHGVAAGDN